MPQVVSPSPSLQPCNLCSLWSGASTGCLHGCSYWLWAWWAGPVILPRWRCGVSIQVLAFLADEQSAQGWRKGAWLCAGSSCPTDVKAAHGNAHLSTREFEAPARWLCWEALWHRRACPPSGAGVEAGSLVAEHSSSATVSFKSQGGAHCSLDFLTTAHKVKAIPRAFLAMGGVRRTAIATVDRS